MLIGRLSQMSPPPCLYDTVIQSYVQLKSGSIERTAHFMGRPTPLKVNGANLVPSCPPGVQLLPHFEVWSYRACQPLQMSPPPCLYDTVIQSYVQLKSGSIERTAHFMGRPTPLKVNGANFSTLLPPRGATFTPF